MTARASLSLLLVCLSVRSLCRPKQVHITLGDHFINPESKVLYRVGFTTDVECKGRVTVEVSDSPRETWRTFAAKCHMYTAPAPLAYSRRRCFSELRGLRNASRFSYRLAVDGESVRGPFVFASEISTSFEPRVAIFGDHDLSPAGRPLLDALRAHRIDLLLHLGDFAYNLHNDNGERGDEYLEALEEVVAHVPIIYTPGNHDHFDNYRLLNARFRLPLAREVDDNNLTAFRVRKTLFLGLNLDFFLEAPLEERILLLEKLEDLLTESSRRSDRHRVFFSHRPLTCGDFVSFKPSQCLVSNFAYQQVVALMEKHGVRFSIAGHVHCYQRLRGPWLFSSPEARRAGAAFVVGTGGNASFFGRLENSLNSNVVKTLDQTAGFLLLRVGQGLAFDFLAVTGETRDSIRFDHEDLSPRASLFETLLLLVVLASIFAAVLARTWIKDKIYARVPSISLESSLEIITTKNKADLKLH